MVTYVNVYILMKGVLVMKLNKKKLRKGAFINDTRQYVYTIFDEQHINVKIFTNSIIQGLIYIIILLLNMQIYL